MNRRWKPGKIHCESGSSIALAPWDYASTFQLRLMATPRKVLLQSSRFQHPGWSAMATTTTSTSMVEPMLHTSSKSAASLVAKSPTGLFALTAHAHHSTGLRKKPRKPGDFERCPPMIDQRTLENWLNSINARYRAEDIPADPLVPLMSDITPQ